MLARTGDTIHNPAIPGLLAVTGFIDSSSGWLYFDASMGEDQAIFTHSDLWTGDLLAVRSHRKGSSIKGNEIVESCLVK